MMVPVSVAAWISTGSQPPQAKLARLSIGVRNSNSSGSPPRRLDAPFPGGAGPHELERTAFRRGGQRHDLLVIADVRRALRDQERLAWQRLVRVLGQEINSSLAPIRSIAQSLSDLLARPDRPDGWEEDATSGLKVVARRTEALGRFTAADARLMKLPPPARAPMHVEAWVRRVAHQDRGHHRVTRLSDGPSGTR